MNLIRALLLFIIVVDFSACTTDSGRRLKQGNAVRRLGEAYLAEGNYPNALRQFLRAEKISPKDPLIQNDLGLTYMAQGRHETAVTYFIKALDLRPEFSDCRNNLGKAYLDMGQWNRAILELEQVAEDPLYTTPQYPLSNLGWAYFVKMEYDRARQYYHKALDVSPDEFVALRGLGRTYVELHDRKRAEYFLTRAAAVMPGLPRIHLDLARAYQNWGDDEKAVLSFEKVLDLAAPGTDIADEAEAELTRLRAGE